MVNLAHPKKVLKALFYAQLWRLKRILGLKSRPHYPVLEGGGGGRSCCSAPLKNL